VADPQHVTSPAAFTVAYVLGVTPGKWAGIWNERMPRHPLVLALQSPAEALSALLDGAADVALLRLPLEHDALSSIPLYVEKPVVVAPKEHAIEALDSVTLADLSAENVLTGDWAADVDLVAANLGVVVVPQSVARALTRRDVVARPVLDGPETRVALAWVTDNTTEAVEEFIGIVRGRTANSSRGEPTPPTPKPERKRVPLPAVKKKNFQPRRPRKPRKP